MRSVLDLLEIEANCPLKFGDLNRRTNREGVFQGYKDRMAGGHFKRLEEQFPNGLPIRLDAPRSTYVNFGKVEVADAIDAGPPVVLSVDSPRMPAAPLDTLG